MQAYRLHDERRRGADGHTLERVDDHEPRADLVDGERLERVLQRTEPLQPAEDGRDVVQVHEEAGVRHLVQRCERRYQDRDATVAEEAGEEEVLRE